MPVVPRMADEADPENVLVVKTSLPGRLIAPPHVGLRGNLEVLIVSSQEWWMKPARATCKKLRRRFPGGLSTCCSWFAVG